MRLVLIYFLLQAVVEQVNIEGYWRTKKDILIPSIKRVLEAKTFREVKVLVTLQWTRITSRERGGSRNTANYFMLQKLWLKLWPGGPLGFLAPGPEDFILPFSEACWPSPASKRLWLIQYKCNSWKYCYFPLDRMFWNFYSHFSC